MASKANGVCVDAVLAIRVCVVAIASGELWWRESVHHEEGCFYNPDRSILCCIQKMELRLPSCTALVRKDAVVLLVKSCTDMDSSSPANEHGISFRLFG